MAGIAFIEGEIGHSGERHLLTLLCDHSGILPVDFRSQQCFTSPPVDVNFEYGVYWPVAPANLVRKLKISINRLSGVRDKLLDTPTDSFSGNAAPLPNCVEAIGRALSTSGIACPFLDLRKISQETDVTDVIRGLAGAGYDQWKTIGNGAFVFLSPAASFMPYDHITGLLDEKLAVQGGFAPTFPLQSEP